jgi:hypothetical protein
MRPRAALIPIFVALIGTPAPGEVPLLRPDELKDFSTHIVTGEVRRIYTDVENDGHYERTNGVAEVAVTGLEKGDGLKAGGLVYARFWGKRWVGEGEPPPDAYGHHDVPAKGKRVRIFLERSKDGGYDVLLPNGFNPIR